MPLSSFFFGIQAITNDLKSKVAELQMQLQRDDRLELIERAINAEVC